jgi:predicted methyltransferase
MTSIVRGAAVVLFVSAAAAACGAAEPTPSVTGPAGTTSIPPPPQKKQKGDGDVAAIKAAVAAPHRSEANRKRDVYRHPVETLTFFGVKSDATVLELSPGNGWYTEILAPMLAEKGKLVVTSVDPNGPQDKPAFKGAHDLAERFAAHPELFGKVKVVRIDPPDQFDFGPDASVDVVLTFRSTHDWVRDGVAEKIYASIFKVLKPGGTLGVVSHRGKPDADPTPAVVGKTGYLSEKFVIDLVEKAGFKLVAKSEVNANPKDVRDYPEGVWTLPPTLRLEEKDKDKYLAIGESDRATLKFVKAR